MYLHVELRSEYVFVLLLQLCSHTYSYFARHSYLHEAADVFHQRCLCAGSGEANL